MNIHVHVNLFFIAMFYILYIFFFFWIRIALELVSRKKNDMKIRYNKSFIDAYLENPVLDIKDIVGMACDMLLAGIDTVIIIIYIII